MYQIIKKFFNFNGWASQSEVRNAIVIHNHLFKNAGSTIDWALKRSFGSSFVDHRDDALMRKGRDYLGPYLENDEHINAISTHHLSFPLPEVKGIHLLVMTMFRHPIERVTSVYNFERKQTCNSTPGVIHARKFSIGEYIEWRLKPEVGSTIRDFHSRRMLPYKKACNEQVTLSELRLVEESVKRSEMIGIVEKFDESMVLFEEEMKVHFPTVDLSYALQNIGQNPNEKQGERLRKLKSEIGEATYSSLEESNQSDLMLHGFVVNEFNRRVSNIDGFQEKLENFRLRCQEHKAWRYKF